MSCIIKNFFDPLTFSHTYVVYDDETLDGLVIDPVLNYDQASSQYGLESVNQILDFKKEKKLAIHYILETHAHADHLTGAQFLKKELSNAKIGIGQNIVEVQRTFKSILSLDQLNTSASQFDLLLNEEQIIKAGSIEIKTIFTPGHTPACCSFLIGDMLFVGDALFMPDYGTGRCDFPQGSAKILYHSVHEKLYSLPDSTRVFTGHDYAPGGRDIAFESTIGQQRKENIQIKDSTTQDEFISFRTKRDKLLSQPKLLFPSIQVNINAGHLPAVSENSVSYLKIPISERKI